MLGTGTPTAPQISHTGWWTLTGINATENWMCLPLLLSPLLQSTALESNVCLHLIGGSGSSAHPQLQGRLESEWLTILMWGEQQILICLGLSQF
jgi:hypothetical protein